MGSTAEQTGGEVRDKLVRERLRVRAARSELAEAREAFRRELEAAAARTWGARPEEKKHEQSVDRGAA